MYNRITKSIILILNLIFWLGLDQWTKIWAVQELKFSQARYYLNGLVRLIYAENTGAWGNLGGTWGEPWKSLFLIFVPVAVLLAILIASVINNKASKLETWSYILIASGGLGNIIDRIRFGYVVDFMYIGTGSWPFQTNIFNVADVVIMIGFGVMLIQIFKDRKKAPSQK